ncbi:hypothetical protein IWW48_004810 [Coemansia sp. RSA 1200]|nr:hypothetical protein IWW48_004810 [Coemansia sp. RSA 1200]
MCPKLQRSTLIKLNGNVGSDKALQMSSGSVFSDLSRILPAPKNSRGTLGRSPVQPSNCGSTMDKDKASGLVQPPVLIPHSLAKRQKAKPADIKGKSVSRDDDVDIVRSPPDDNKLQVRAIDDDGTHLDPEDAGPFFTINESKQNILQEDHQDDEDAIPAGDSAKDNVGTATEDPQAGGAEMYYDPNSGYYYDYANGLYYYYDQDRGCYIDARDIYRDQNDPQHMTGSEAGIYKGDNLLQESKIDKADMERLIGRGALKRGEADAIFGAAVKDLSHQSQLAGSGYSDAKSGTDFAAKRAAERRRRETHKIIESDQVDKKKKQKHNIMYLALRAQEQESELKEAHANRKNARKAARSKYGL